MRRFLPDSLSGWVFTAILGVAILVHGFALIGYLVFRDEAAIAAAASQAADQLIVFKRLVERAPQQGRLQLVQRMNSPGLRMVITRRPIVQDSDSLLTSRIVLRKLRREFPEGTDIRVDSRIGAASTAEQDFPTPEEVWRQLRRERGDIELSRRMRPDAGPSPPPRSEERYRARRRQSEIERTFRELRGFQPFFRASIQVRENAWVNAQAELDFSEQPDRMGPMAWMTGITLLIAAVALWGIRHATRPLLAFAGAAERLGVDVNAEPLTEKGTGEVRRAARAFNTMQTRLKRFILDRTQMLAAISHDLRTPITRLRLRAELIDDSEQRQKMRHDLDEMEIMIAATLAFSRDDAANEPIAPTDVAKMLTNLCEDQYANGYDVTYTGPDSCELNVKPLALKRAVTNLVQNGAKYGERARVNLEVDGGQAEIIIDDDGPGIPGAQQERVFAPFFRLEESRSRETGGSGLGMTIARSAIRSMGGDIELVNRAEGGLRIKVTLPAAEGLRT